MLRRTLQLAAVLLLPFAAGAARAAVQQPLSIVSSGLQRDYILVSPVVSAPGPRPLVLLLHGHLGTAANALGAGRVPSPLSAWLPIVDREQVLVAALQGLKGSDNHTGWDDCRVDATEDPKTDDVGFARDVVAGLVQSGRVDPHRIYVMGMSNGAMMSFRLAFEMRPTPAAIAAVSGTMAASSVCSEPPPRVSVLLMDGTDDPIVPYAGGAVGLGRHRTGVVIGALRSRDFWVHAEGLDGVPGLTSVFPHLDPDDPTQAVRQTWGPAAGPQVELVTIQNGGHVEPSQLYHYGWFYSRLVGKQNRDFESVEEAWSFFRTKRSQ
jgi:polyhydroxybutyrate depolymerase